MEYKTTAKPTKEEQKVAMESYRALAATLKEVRDTNPEIEIEETQERIRVPLKALKLLADILEATAAGKPVSIVPLAAEMTTQAAADMIGCSRPHFVKLLEDGAIPYTKVGKHRRVQVEDVIHYKKGMKAKQAQLLEEMMRVDEETGLYDS